MILGLTNVTFRKRGPGSRQNASRYPQQALASSAYLRMVEAGQERKAISVGFTWRAGAFIIRPGEHRKIK